MSKITKKLSAVRYRYRLPLVYVFLVVAALILLLFPLILCPNILGQKLCAPFGFYLAALVSIPGYVFGGMLLGLFQITATLATFSIIFIFSIIFYYILGRIVELYAPGSKRNKIELVIILFFVALIHISIMLFSFVGFN